MLLDEKGEPHVADFGIAKRIDTGASTTGTLGVVGTPAYMAPEQMELGAELTVGTDVWALGCILYELLAGRPPFTADELADLTHKIREEEPFPLRALAPDAPRDLETIALKCLEKDPARRYASASEVAEDLEAWLRHEPIRARRTSAPERLYLYWRRSPLVASLIAAVFLLAGALGAGAVWANVELEDRLREAYVEQARATRRSDEAGRRSRALALLADAAEIRPGQDVRDEAIACLALTDLAREIEHEKTRIPLRFDARLEHTLVIERDDAPRAYLVRVADAEELQTFALPGLPRGARFSGNGELIAIKCHSVSDQEQDASVSVFETASGSKLWSRPEAVSFKSFTFDEEGARLAVGRFDGTVRVHDVRTGEELSRCDVGARTGDVAFHPNGRSIAVAVGGGRNLLQVRALPEGTLLEEFGSRSPPTTSRGCRTAGSPWLAPTSRATCSNRAAEPTRWS